MGDVIPILKCKCGFPAKPVELEFRGEVIGTFKACGICIQETTDRLARVRPVFEAMLAAGITRENANKAMTYLLELE